MPTALITGATAGIGATFARHLAQDGYRLALVARDQTRLAQRQAELTEFGAAHVQLLPADLAISAQRDAICDRLRDPLEPIDLLVNNAGIGLGKDFLDATPDELNRQIELNITAVTMLSRAALPGMVERGFGAVINVASIAGLLPGRGTSYAGSKAYVISLSEGLSTSLAGTGVRVQALCPGFVKTEFHDRAGIDMHGTPTSLYVDVDRVVRISLADLRANKPLSVPGGLYKTIAAVAGLAPRGMVRGIAARVNNAHRT